MASPHRARGSQRAQGSLSSSSLFSHILQPERFSHLRDDVITSSSTSRGSVFSSFKDDDEAADGDVSPERFFEQLRSTGSPYLLKLRERVDEKMRWTEDPVDILDHNRRWSLCSRFHWAADKHTLHAFDRGKTLVAIGGPDAEVKILDLHQRDAKKFSRKWVRVVRDRAPDASIVRSRRRWEEDSLRIIGTMGLSERPERSQRPHAHPADDHYEHEDDEYESDEQLSPGSSWFSDRFDPGNRVADKPRGVSTSSLLSSVRLRRRSELDDFSAPPGDVDHDAAMETGLDASETRDDVLERIFSEKEEQANFDLDERPAKLSAAPYLTMDDLQESLSEIGRHSLKYDLEHRETMRHVTPIWMPARIGHVAWEDEWAPYDAQDRSIVVFGGADQGKGKYFNDWWKLYLDPTPHFEELPRPSGYESTNGDRHGQPKGRWLHTASSFQAPGVSPKIFIFGGELSTLKFTDELLVYCPLTHSWITVRGSVASTGHGLGSAPSARSLHSSVVLKSSMYVIGGYGDRRIDGARGSSLLSGVSSSTGLLDDVWTYDAYAMVWKRESSMSGKGPLSNGGRSGHVSWTRGSSIFVFGGSSACPSVVGNGGWNDCWHLDTRSGRWYQVLYDHRQSTHSQVPIGRCRHACWSDSKVAYIYGGLSDGGRAPNDLWSLDLQSP